MQRRNELDTKVRNWAEECSPEARFALAAASAARAFPNIGVLEDAIVTISHLSVLRQIITAIVGSKYKNVELAKATNSIKQNPPNCDYASDPKSCFALSAAIYAADAEKSSGYNERFVFRGSRPVHTNGDSVAHAVLAALSATGNSSEKPTFQTIELLKSSPPHELFSQPLWLDETAPKGLLEAWTSLRDEWSTDPAMAFWIDWYDGLLVGRAPDWDLWNDIVLIDDEHWKAGPEAVAREIELVKARLVAKRAPQDETIEIDEQTGKFKLKFSEPAKPDLLGATLDQIGDALDDAMANPSNGLHERSREVRVLQRALTKYANSPQRLEMDFTSVHGSLTRQIAKDELPPSEENLALLQATQEGAQGIRATHPDIAENRAILQNRAIAEMSKEDRDFVQDSVEVLEDLSQGILAEEFVEDAAEIYEQEAEAENHRKLGAYERNPGLVARDEKVRFFGRAAKILLELKKNPKVASIINKGNLIDVGMNLAMLNGLIDIALKVFGLF